MDRRLRVRLKWHARLVLRVYDGLVEPRRCPGCGHDGVASVLCAACRDGLEVVEPGLVCARCTGPLPCRDCGRFRVGLESIQAAYFYKRSGGALVRRVKLSRDTAALGVLARGMARGFERRDAAYRRHVVVPVPLHRARARERGFNQAAELGRFVAARLGIALVPHALRRVRATAPQGSAFVASRASNVAGAFAPGRAHRRVRGRSVLLVDDVVTSGATLRECARVLRRGAAVQRVAAVVACTARASGS